MLLQRGVVQRREALVVGHRHPRPELRQRLHHLHSYSNSTVRPLSLVTALTKTRPGVYAHLQVALVGGVVQRTSFCPNQDKVGGLRAPA
eukprot:510181-Prorocentrum_minimum.AAC.1